VSDIQIEARRRSASPARARESLAQALIQMIPIRQTGEVIHPRERAQPRLNLLRLGDISHHRVKTNNRPALVKIWRVVIRIDMHNAAFQELIGDRTVTGRPFRDALPELDGQGYFELLDSIRGHGRAYVGNEMKLILSRGAGTSAKVDPSVKTVFA
jgi:hypothetical protein